MMLPSRTEPDVVAPLFVARYAEPRGFLAAEELGRVGEMVGEAALL